VSPISNSSGSARRPDSSTSWTSLRCMALRSSRPRGWRGPVSRAAGSPPV